MVDPKKDRGESFEEFKNSFSYGARTDLNFKFIKGLTEQDASKFFQDLLWNLSESFDKGDCNQLLEYVFEWQVKAYDGHGRWTYEEGPFTRLEKPISDSMIGLVTSSGHFVEGEDPEPFGVKGMTQEEATERIVDFLNATPELSVIPVDTPIDMLNVRHGGYDIRSAQADPNVAFPLERLRELREEEVIGGLSPMTFSFVGATSQQIFLDHVGPEWVERIQGQGVDGVILVPV
jgi:D-proline reductase (dithiol) PrdB